MSLANLLQKAKYAYRNTFSAAAPKTSATYFSKYGGLWTDRMDFELLLQNKINSGAVNSQQAELLRFWVKNGYVILPQAVSHEAIDRLNKDLELAWEAQDNRYKVQTSHGNYLSLIEADRKASLVKLLDSYVYSKAALDVIFSPAICDFIKLLYSEEILAFQSLSFEMGSTQAIHQDTAYVVCSRPMELVASWVAREDIQKGSGELCYYPSSHRFPEYDFSNKNRKHWNLEKDGNPVHDEFLQYLHKMAKERDIPLQYFLPKKGDVLIWSADLAHGGAPIEDSSLTRKSYVTHYCPYSVDPYYFSYLAKNQTKKQAKHGCYYSSSHYVMSENS